MAGATYPLVHQSFKETLLESYQSNDINILTTKFNETPGVSSDKKAILDQAFRDILLTDIINETSKIELLIKLSIAACRDDIATPMIPVVLLSDVFDAVTLDQCEALFTYVEDNVAVWRESWFFTTGKNNLLRVCNDLLKRFSRAQNTVFCGRILLFLATFFPFSERSGLNIISEFNLENLTEFESDSSDLTDGISVENSQVKIDFNLYSKFWALQDYFRNPNQCYDSKEWKTFSGYVTNVLLAFKSFKLEEQRGTAVAKPNATSEMLSVEQEVAESQHFFAKFLTNPKLLTLQLSDSNFRRSVLLQCLILFQYLITTVKFKTDSHTLVTAQLDYIRETESDVYKLLEETPPNGKKFSKTVRHMLKREELWNNWKNDGCKEFKRPEIPEDEQVKSPAKKLKRNLGDSIRDNSKQGKFYLGNSELTRLWNVCPDNLLACSSEDRNFLPSIETYLDKASKDDSYEWRGLRLLSRQSSHFFTQSQNPMKISDYFDMVRKKMVETKTKNKVLETESKTDTENDFVVDKEDVLAEEDTEMIKSEPLADDRNVHKTSTATPEQMKELSVIIGGDWKKCGPKLGFTDDVLQFFVDENPTEVARCCAMLANWFDNDDDANLDNLCYILEGLEMIAAADCVKRFLEPADKMEDISE